MTAIWQKAGSGWHLLAPKGFPDEAALHKLVEEAPDILPLSGSPRLIVLGREVALGNGYADLIAIEPSGRPAVIEIKLAKNPEAQRAVVAQVLAYVAYLRGLDVDTFEHSVLASHLQSRGYDSIAGALSANDQEGSLDNSAAMTTLRESLAAGSFRLVLVLDQTPDELVRLVGYLEAVTQGLVMDLITVSSYEINGSQVLVPQRVEPERDVTPRMTVKAVTPHSEGYLADGADDFAASIDAAKPEHQEVLRRLYTWAKSLEANKLAKLSTYHGKGRLTLLPRLIMENVGLVTLWNDNGPSISFWRSVFERRAPHSIPKIEEIIGKAIGTGNTTKVVSGQLLSALTAAYHEAASGRVDV